MLYRFTVWNDPAIPTAVSYRPLPPGVVRHGISVEIEAPTYEKAVELLKEGYADGKYPLSAGSADKWLQGNGETIVSLGMHRPSRPPKEPS